MDVLKNQQQKTMHTNPEQNLLAITELAVKKNVFLSNIRNQKYHKFVFRNPSKGRI